MTQYSTVGGMRTYSAVAVIVVFLTLFELWLNLILLIAFIRRTEVLGLVGPPAETEKPPLWVAFLLVDQLGLEPRTDRL